VADVLIIDLHPQTVLIRRRLEVPGKVGETFAIDCALDYTYDRGRGHENVTRSAYTVCPR